MRFCVIGCTVAAVLAAGCGDKSDSTVSPASTAPKAETKGAVGKLVIEDTKVGTGPAAKNGDMIAVEYTGSLANAQVFDSTSQRDDAPIVFKLGKGDVIPGWDKGLVGVREGGERKLSIPYALAYGDQAKDKIPAKADLFFEIKVDKVIDAADVNDDVVRITQKGTGPKVKPGDTVEVMYTGMFLNGKVFDTNRKEGGQPLEVKVGAGNVVPGFDKALEGMQKGEKRNVTIPPMWGYGMKAQGPIPANSWLVFDIEIASIK